MQPVDSPSAQGCSRFSKPQNSSSVPIPVRHSESPLTWKISASRSKSRRRRWSSPVHSSPPTLRRAKVWPQERLLLWGMVITSQSPLQLSSSQAQSSLAVCRSRALMASPGTSLPAKITLRCSIPPAGRLPVYS